MQLSLLVSLESMKTLASARVIGFLLLQDSLHAYRETFN